MLLRLAVSYFFELPMPGSSPDAFIWPPGAVDPSLLRATFSCPGRTPRNPLLLLPRGRATVARELGQVLTLPVERLKADSN